MFNLLPFPYRSKISFVPLIKYWEGKLKSGSKVEQLIAMAIQEQLAEQGAILKKPIENLSSLEGLEELISLLTSVFFPHQDQEAMVRLSGPFNTLPFYHSPPLNSILKQNTITTNIDKNPERVYQYIVYRTGCMILDQFYGQHLQFDVPYIFSVNAAGRRLKNHYQTEIDSRFTDVIKLKRLKKLSEEQIQELISNVEDTELWLKYLPPSHFEFQGVFCTLLTDATESETLSQLKDSLLQRDALLSNEKINLLEENLCTYFKQPDLRMGVCAIDKHQVKGVNEEQSIRHGLITDKFPKLLRSKYKNAIYQKVVASGEFIVIENLIKYPDPTPLEEELLAKGFRSILVAPLTNKYKEVIGLLELASPIAFNLNSVSALMLKNIIPLFNVAIERSQVEITNQVEAIIRKNFTSIHPSIEWAFVDQAYRLLKAKNPSEILNEDQFIFRDNYPLYGQADIVSSTVTRNLAIQADLIDNLYRIKKLLIQNNKNYTFPLADQLLLDVDRHIRLLKTGCQL